MNTPRCTCGTVEKHITATRKLMGGHVVQIWSDGALTHMRNGQYVGNKLTTSRKILANVGIDRLCLYTSLELCHMANVK